MPGFIRVEHAWTSDERWSAVRCRLGRFGAHSRIPPGLYALGSPGEDSAVFVTASYRLAFDLLRRDLEGTDCWILALDTRGLDVGSAAAAGRFSTDELVTRVLSARLASVVRHRRLILPLRAAAAVDSEAVFRGTGFRVLPGPERSSEAAAFLAGRATSSRPFGPVDAAVLIPAEVGRSLVRFPAFAFAALLYAGLGPGGVNLQRALAGGWSLLVFGLAAVVCGSALAPLLSAAAPAVPLWVSGLLAGAAGTAALLEGAGLAARMDPWLHAACWLFFPAASAGLAAQFRRALPVSASSPTGPARAVLAAAAALIAMLVIAALVLSKAARWG